MQKISLILLCVVVLGGCQKPSDYARKWGLTGQAPQMMEGSNYYQFPEISPGKQYRAESSFCYRVQTDVLCYDKPRKGWEDRMVGYQEPLRPVSAPVKRMNIAAPQMAVQQQNLTPLPRMDVSAPPAMR